jgi:hypothetical protein
MINLILLIISFSSYAGPRGIASFEERVTSNAYKACIRSLAEAPTTPTYPKTYFQELLGQESFTLRCHQEDTKENMRFLFVLDESYYGLTLPMYYYDHVYRDGSKDKTELPRNIIHFRHRGKDLYLEMGFVDSANIRTPAELPQAAKENMTSVAKVQSEYVKKYEDWLRSQGKFKSIETYPLDETELSYMQSCLDNKIKAIVEIYLTNKFGKMIPAYGTMVNDSRNHQQLSSEDQKKYQRPFADLEGEILADLTQHPDCQTAISDQKWREGFEKAFGRNRSPYETLRRVFFGGK